MSGSLDNNENHIRMTCYNKGYGFQYIESSQVISIFFNWRVTKVPLKNKEAPVEKES